MRYEIPYNEIKTSISGKEFKKIAIQLPEGLKRYGKEIIQKLEKEVEKELILSGYPCYGACDTKDKELEKLGIDKIIHLGHFKIPFKQSIETEYFPIKSNLKIKNTLEKTLEFIDKNEIGLITTPQHIHKIDKIKEFFKNKGIEAKTSKGNKRITSEGLVLGCNFSAAKIKQKETLYIGSGEFHPLGVALSNKSKVIAANPETNQIKEIGYKNFIKKRYSIIGKIKDLNDFGILISTKKGQIRYNLAKKIRKIIEKANKTGDLIAIDDVLPNELINFGYEAYVNTSCPRLSIDDYNKFEMPIITPNEAKIAFGEKDYQKYEMDEF
ncbi:diphthamide biosynthesis enzyme Dph2 [archaeon SCG-AAA382B04]|nr:diphthamide biosynthesis enzyme Dph2 [archaeon SCG-AAA382B04]